MEGTFVRTIRQNGKGKLQFSYPNGIATHPTGKLYIADTYNDRIQVLNSDMTFSNMFGSHSSGQGQFNKPQSVACDSHGDIYVTDFENHRVVKLTAEGKFLSTIGSKELGHDQFMYLVGICVDSTDTMFVSDYYCVSVFTNAGKFLKFLVNEQNQRLKNPYGLVVNNSGHLYVCARDYVYDCVVIY